MVKLKVHNPPKIKLKSSGYMGEPTGEIEIFENGDWNVKPYATAKVRVPLPSGQAPTIITNGTYNIYDYSTVIVDVQPLLMVKNISENGTYYASQDGADGYSDVIVDVHPAPLTAMGIDNSGWFLSNNSAENQELILGEDQDGIYLEREVS